MHVFSTESIMKPVAVIQLSETDNETLPGGSSLNTEIKETGCLALTKQAILLEYVFWCPDLHGSGSWPALAMTLRQGEGRRAAEETMTLSESGEPGWKTSVSPRPLHRISHTRRISDELPAAVRKWMSREATGELLSEDFFFFTFKNIIWWTTYLKTQSVALHFSSKPSVRQCVTVTSYATCRSGFDVTQFGAVKVPSSPLQPWKSEGEAGRADDTGGVQCPSSHGWGHRRPDHI